MRETPTLALALFALACSSSPTRPDPAPVPAEGPAEEPAAAATPPAARPSGKYATPGAGEAQVTLEGCLSAAPSEEQGARHAARAIRGPAPPEVVVSVGGLGVIVSHELQHPCCLSARVETAVAAGEVRLTERLEGRPCRCRCASTIRTEVGLEPGDYTLVLELDQGQGPREVHRAPVAVRQPLRR